ncbi:OSCP, subunit 5 of the stator stalk of mitochondrial F1F0 ATP synthase [Amanita muscaria]
MSNMSGQASPPMVLIKLATLASTVMSRPEISAFVHNPTLSNKDRLTGLSTLFSTLEGPKKEPLLGEMEGAIQEFNELVAQYKGELTILVTSAKPLPKDVATHLETTLKQSQAGQKAKALKLVNKVNPSVLGGIIVDFGDKTIDLSVSSRVTKLNNTLQQSV